MKALEFIPSDMQYPDPEGSVFITVGSKATLEDIRNEVDKMGDFYLPEPELNSALSYLDTDIPPRSGLKSIHGTYVAISYSREISTFHGDRDDAVEWLWEVNDNPVLYRLRFIKRKLTPDEIDVIKEKTIVRLMRRACISDGLLREIAEEAILNRGINHFTQRLKELGS